MLRHGVIPLVEREFELAALERAVEAAREGAGAVVVVEGPPGIGKSRLLAAARTVAADLRVVSARASELERDFPFGVVRQLLEPVLAGAAGEERRALLAGAGALAEPALTLQEDADEPPLAALHGLYWFAANLAARGPLLMLVDDVHWTDRSSLRWLVYLVKRIDGLALALVLGARSSGPGAPPELLDELASDPTVEVLHPGALTEAAVARLAELSLDAPVELAFASACHLATGGNPFLLAELLGELAHTGLAPSAENAAVVTRLSSRGVRRAVTARLRRLPPACDRLARAVVILGDGAELALAARLAELDGHAASQAADALSAAAILDAGRPLAFVHPLVRASVGAELTAGERDEWHARAAAALRELAAPADRIAVHRLACEPRGDPDAAADLREGASGARRRGALDVAARYLRRALREPPPPQLEPQVMFEAGTAELQAGEIDAAAQHLQEAAGRLSGARPRALAAEELGSALAFTDRPVEAVTALNQAIAELSDDDRELGLLLQATRTTVAHGSPAAWREMLRAGTRFDLAAGRPATTGERLRVAELAVGAMVVRTAAEARGLALTAVAGGHLLEDPRPTAGSFFIAPSVLMFSDALGEAIRVFGEAIQWARRHGSIAAFSAASHLRAYTWWRRGALGEVAADAESARQHDVSFFGMPYGALALVEAMLAGGDVAAAAEVWHSSGLEAHAGASIGDMMRLHTRAHLQLATSGPEDALGDLFACGRLEAQWRLLTPCVSTWRADAAQLLALLGRGDEARRLAQEELDRCLAFGAARPLGAALRAAALVGPPQRRMALLKEAVGVLERSPARLEHALALFDCGAALRRANERRAARERLRVALEVALACGAGALATRARDELIAAGARPRRDPIESRSRLTASELRVARMAAEGMSNREIAQALFLTEKTIEVHLTRVYRKLDIHSRTQLTHALTSPKTHAGVAAPT